jgi:hypothetical protein
MIKAELITLLGRLTGANMGLNGMTVDYSLNQHLNLTATLLLPKQPRWNHLGVIEHHKITRLNMPNQVSELLMLQHIRRRIKVQQTTALTLRCRLSSN